MVVFDGNNRVSGGGGADDVVDERFAGGGGVARERGGGVEVGDFLGVEVRERGEREVGGFVASEEVDVEGVVFVGEAELMVERLPGAGAGAVDGVAGFPEPLANVAEALLFEVGDLAVAVGGDVGEEDHVSDDAVGEVGDDVVAGHDFVVGDGVGVDAPAAELDGEAFVADIGGADGAAGFAGAFFFGDVAEPAVAEVGDGVGLVLADHSHDAEGFLPVASSRS